MSKTIRITIDDATAHDIETCAIYRFGDGPAVLSEYVKIAVVQLMRRDLVYALKSEKYDKAK